jgi:hypothetical protein
VIMHFGTVTGSIRLIKNIGMIFLALITSSSEYRKRVITAGAVSQSL